MHPPLQIRAVSAPWHAGIDFLVRKGDANCTDLVFTTLTPGSYHDRTLTLDHDQAQTLMDDLWQCGLRPTEGSGSAGALAATQRHLEDMRTLVFADKKPAQP